MINTSGVGAYIYIYIHTYIYIYIYVSLSFSLVLLLYGGWGGTKFLDAWFTRLPMERKS